MYRDITSLNNESNHSLSFLCVFLSMFVCVKIDLVLETPGGELEEVGECFERLVIREGIDGLQTHIKLILYIRNQDNCC